MGLRFIRETVFIFSVIGLFVLLLPLFVQTLLLPNKPYERFRVTEEGTLIIEAVRSEDAGEYACHGLNIAGSAYAKAQLDIKGMNSNSGVSRAGVSPAIELGAGTLLSHSLFFHVPPSI